MKGLPRSLAKLYDLVNLGAVSGAGVQGSGPLPGAIGTVKETITLVDVNVIMTDNVGTTAYGGLKIFDFAEGLILFHGAVLDLDLTKSSAGINDTWAGDVGLGTVTASDDATPLATTEQDLVPNTATPAATSGATTADAQSTGTESGSLFDGTTTPVDVFLNFLVDDADHDVNATPANIIVNGTITLIYTPLGDN